MFGVVKCLLPFLELVFQLGAFLSFHISSSYIFVANLQSVACTSASISLYPSNKSLFSIHSIKSDTIKSVCWKSAELTLRNVELLK